MEPVYNLRLKVITWAILSKNLKRFKKKGIYIVNKTFSALNSCFGPKRLVKFGKKKIY